MTYYRRLAAQIDRFGQTAAVEIRNETGTNEFGNKTDEFVPSHTVLAFQTYPNRNTEVERRSGDRHQDRPVFLVPKGPEQNDPPAPDDRLVYKNKTYEVDSHTEYDTHVEFFGQPVIHSQG